MNVEAEKTIMGHPRALFVLFFAEMWERFSYYGMRALLVLYMTKAMSYDDHLAHGTYGAYIGFVYATPIIGGALADRFLGARKAIVLGGVLMAAGHFVMAIEQPFFFYLAMGMIIAGNGFFKPNVSTMVGSIYEKDDPRRDSAFTIFYMGINVGAFFAPLACGLVGETYGWVYGFGLAGIGMVIGLLTFLKWQHLLGPHGLPPRPEALWEKSKVGLPKTLLLWIAIAAFVPFAAYLLKHPDFVQAGVYILGPLTIMYVTYEAMRCTPLERGRLFVLLILITFSITFWACFEQAGSSFTLFADRHMDRHVFGYEIPASALQAVNPGFILIFGFIFSYAWTALGRAHRDPSSPIKFSLGLIQLGLGFVAMVIAAQGAKDGSLASIWWMILAYMLHTTGELCLSPVGLSTITRMSPPRLVGLMMGVWFLSNAFAGVLSGVIAGMTGGDAGYEKVYMMVVYCAIGVGVALFILTPFLNRLGPDPKMIAQKAARERHTDTTY